MKKTNYMTDEVAKQECSNNKYYTSAFRDIYIYIYIYIYRICLLIHESLYNS